jgi:hypothetical protein
MCGILHPCDLEMSRRICSTIWLVPLIMLSWITKIKLELMTYEVMFATAPLHLTDQMSPKSQQSLPEIEASPRVKFISESLPLGSQRRALWRESNKKLLAKKKTLSEEMLRREQKNCQWRILRRESFDWLSAKKFFAESFFALNEEIFLKKTFLPSIFLSSTCTYTKDMFKFDAILSLFAILKNFT